MNDEDLTPVLPAGRTQRIEDRLTALERASQRPQISPRQFTLGLLLAALLLFAIVGLAAAVVSEVHR